ncbi:M23 family metallopeptidase [Pseudomonas sp. PDM24]|uniref:M23 family metallopeptidase n=1 Tax=Pseudomonas sp. PDM24 TaxID=2854777 RepID=UPI001C46A826|nr:M23 family metallopeptidase [Pseudomonas sp. PDM24]MBV7494648.1 M23 family metallopeptidase [Pseudomonas sp. PDM24]
MIISPPFLPAPLTGESDEAFIARAMLGGTPGDGSYPLSFDLNWHSGVHLTAPREGADALPVRAIADGKLVYFRPPAEQSSDTTEPLYYRESWTDNGCIVLKHETEIGEGDSCKVVYFSIYMHLSKLLITPAPVIGAQIYRKDELGRAGKIYGQPDKIHFEIISGEVDKLVGRITPALEYKTTSGRKESCWGDMHFFLPSEAVCYAEHPASWAETNNVSAVVARPQEDLFVRMRYEKGKCVLSTYTEDGGLLGEFTEADNFEYKLFETANERFSACPSAGFELLRFGRVLGSDALQPVAAAHWRQIFLPAGNAWVNLNGSTVSCFSDSDFPSWQGWQLIDDDVDTDSHCQSSRIRELLKLNGNEQFPDDTDAISIANSSAYSGMSAEEKIALSERYVIERSRNTEILSLAESQEKLKRCIVKFPSEWNKGDFDARYGWLLKVAEGGALPQESYDKLKAHQEKLAFWEEAALDGITSNHWHFPPKEFIATFRKCSWLSRNELVQLLPMNSLRKANPTWQWESVSLPNASIMLSSSNADALTRRIDLNKALRKFLVVTPVRLACFFGNATQETQWYQKLHEGSQYWYKPWDGRGFLQLTHASNYIKYWKFKGEPVSQQVSQILATHTAMANNNRPIVNGNKSMYDPTNSLSDASTGIPQAVIAKREAVKTSFDAANSAGAYWAWSGASKQADGYYSSTNSTLRALTTNAQTKHYYENTAFGNVAATVNLGSPSTNFASIWGVQARFLAFANAQVVLLDHLVFPTSTGSSSNTPQDFVRRSIE